MCLMDISNYGKSFVSFLCSFIKIYTVEKTHSLLGIIITVSNASDFCILVIPAYHF